MAAISQCSADICSTVHALTSPVEGVAMLDDVVKSANNLLDGRVDVGTGRSAGEGQDPARTQLSAKKGTLTDERGQHRRNRAAGA